MTRRSALAFDEFGQDPIATDIIDRILAISDSSPFTVTAKYSGNPQLLAHDRLGSVELYWVLLFYNGIGDSFAFVEGTKIQIPNAATVKLILNPTRSSRGVVGTITL